jgi:hypothetical protein
MVFTVKLVDEVVCAVPYYGKVGFHHALGLAPASRNRGRAEVPV